MVRVFPDPGTAITAAIPSRKFAAFSCSLFKLLNLFHLLVFDAFDCHVQSEHCGDYFIHLMVRFISRDKDPEFLLVFSQ